MPCLRDGTCYFYICRLGKGGRREVGIGRSERGGRREERERGERVERENSVGCKIGFTLCSSIQLNNRRNVFAIKKTIKGKQEQI